MTYPPPPDPGVPLLPRRGVPWRHERATLSLPEVHGSVAIPKTASFWRKMLAFAGPGYLVAVGYMDPGNWATDIEGGARYGYALLSMIMMSNLMAIVLQALSARLGIASGRDLAQACRDAYSRPTTIVNVAPGRSGRPIVRFGRIPRLTRPGSNRIVNRVRSPFQRSVSSGSSAPDISCPFASRILM